MAVSIMARHPGPQESLRRPQAAHGPRSHRLPIQLLLASIRTGRAPVPHARLDQGGLLRHQHSNQPACRRYPARAQPGCDRAVEIHDVEEIEKAIQTSDSGFNRSRQDHSRAGSTDDEERRRDAVVKHNSRGSRRQRTAVHNVRRDGNDALKKRWPRTRRVSEGRREAALSRRKSRR